MWEYKEKEIEKKLILKNILRFSKYLKWMLRQIYQKHCLINSNKSTIYNEPST